MSNFRYLVDVNLPKHFKFFNGPNFMFVSDIDRCMTDQRIWDYAFESDLVILTKDTDFFYHALLSGSKVKVVHLEIGNTTIRDLHAYFELHWNAIESLLQTARIVIARKDSLQAII